MKGKTSIHSLLFHHHHRSRHRRDPEPRVCENTDSLVKCELVLATTTATEQVLITAKQQQQEPEKDYKIQFISGCVRESACALVAHRMDTTTDIRTGSLLDQGDCLYEPSIKLAEMWYHTNKHIDWRASNQCKGVPASSSQPVFGPDTRLELTVQTYLLFYGGCSCLLTRDITRTNKHSLGN